MKLTNILLSIFMCLCIVGCTGNDNSIEPVVGGTKDKVVIYTTIFPLYDFARNVGGEQVEVNNIIPPGTDPHNWEPSPKDIAKLQQADIIVYCGAGLEPWLQPVLDSFGSKAPLLVDSSKGIVTEHADAKDDVHHHDPHLWLDPLNAQIQVDNITEALIKVDPGNANHYKLNQSAYRESLQQLHEKYQRELTDVPIKKFVTSHDAFGYLAKRYGLEQIAIRGLSPEVEPSPARLAEVVKLCRQNSIKHIFFEHFVSPKVSQTIANEIGGGTLILHPIATVTSEQLKQGVDYISLMEENLNNLLIALGGNYEQ